MLIDIRLMIVCLLYLITLGWFGLFGLCFVLFAVVVFLLDAWGFGCLLLAFCGLFVYLGRLACCLLPFAWLRQMYCDPICLPSC